MSFKQLCSVVVVASVASAAQAAVITTDTVVRFSSPLQNFDNRNAENISNDSFVKASTGGDPGPGHTADPAQAMWLTIVPGLGGTDTDPYVVIDLGATHNLGSFQVWNYNETSGLGRGVKDVNILVSTTTSDDAAFTSVGNFVFAQAPGTNGYVGEVISFQQTARFVKLDITNNYAGSASTGYGLSEIQFSTIPEPASLALVAAGAVLTLGRRRNEA